MRVYHGSIYKVEHPDLLHSKLDLDFGRGFYVTTYREQAERWARRKAWQRPEAPFLNVYELDEDWTGLKVLQFPKICKKWLDFVCNCRRGKPLSEELDIIFGPVADDDVIQSVTFYYRGLWTWRRTLKELAFAHPNDQIVMVSQVALNKLAFVEAISLEK